MACSAKPRSCNCRSEYPFCFISLTMARSVSSICRVVLEIRCLVLMYTYRPFPGNFKDEGKQDDHARRGDGKGRLSTPLVHDASRRLRQRIHGLTRPRQPTLEASGTRLGRHRELDFEDGRKEGRVPNRQSKQQPMT